MKTEYKEGELLEFNENGDTKLFGLDYTEMVYVEKGTFNIGDNSSGVSSEREATITFDNSYFIGKYPVTQELYEYVTEKRPSKFNGKYRPVESVSWKDLCEEETCFFNRLNFQIKNKYAILHGRFELPSEAQWVYSARGGRAYDKPKLQFAGSNNIIDVAWIHKNSNGRTMPVGLKQPNILGIYDMSGNVYEWCMDFYTEDYLKIPSNGKSNLQTNTYHVIRGGSWNYFSKYCRVECRDFNFPDFRNENYGFRLVFNVI